MCVKDEQKKSQGMKLSQKKQMTGVDPWEYIS